MIPLIWHLIRGLIFPLFCGVWLWYYLMLSPKCILSAKAGKRSMAAFSSRKICDEYTTGIQANQFGIFGSADDRLFLRAKRAKRGCRRLG